MEENMMNTTEMPVAETPMTDAQVDALFDAAPVQPEAGEVPAVEAPEEYTEPNAEPETAADDNGANSAAPDGNEAQAAEQSAEMPDEAGTAPRRTARGRRTRRAAQAMQNAAAENEEPINYMGDAYEVIRPADVVKEELKRMQAIIEHNAQVQRTQRGKLIVLTAEMTSVHQFRRNGNARQLEGIAVHGIELREKGLKGSIPLVFDGNDFTHYSNLHPQNNEEDFDLPASQLQYVSRMTGCKFQFIPLRIAKTENQAPFVVCSRSFAMELQQQRFFFGDEPLAAEGKPVYAYVLSANAHAVRVECMGVETSIPRAYLSARSIVMNAAEYVGAKPGMALEVAISRLDVDKENRIVDLRLSGVLREIQLGLAHSVKDIDPAARPRYHGSVYAISRNYYIIRLEENGIFALVPRSNGVINAESLQYNDSVSVEVTGKDEETNRVIGRCVLRARA